MFVSELKYAEGDDDIQSRIHELKVSTTYRVSSNVKKTREIVVGGRNWGIFVADNGA